MNTLGEISLLVAFVASGYAAFACLAGRGPGRRAIGQSGLAAGLVSVAALSVVTAVLAYALLIKDFRFQYVAHYSSELLPWYYSLSAFWVGQAGSLLLWAWLLALLALVLRFGSRREAGGLEQPAFGLLMAYLCFLVAVLVFAADPMESNLAIAPRGDGLSPLLQHPAMLIHPPIVFLGYAGWAIPFVLAISALAAGRLDGAWVRLARRWAFFSWAVLGIGILLGAVWAYEELGWGGYWGWDPVENGSLMPWLSGTALVHCLMGWHYRGVLKKTVCLLAIVTFGLCNFATFLTRSGIFSSLHAFSQSPIGWMFLGWMVVLAACGVALVAVRRSSLRPDRPMTSLASREAAVLISALALLLLVAVTFLGTVSVPLSNLVLGRKIVVGAAFYNDVLIPIALVLLAATAAAPLLRWGLPPTAQQRRALGISILAGVAAAAIALVRGVRHPLGLAVAGLAAAAVAALAAALVLDAQQDPSAAFGWKLLRALRANRRRYAGFLVHMGFVCLVVGVAGSSLGTRRQELIMREGETVSWAGRSIHYAGLIQRELPDKSTVEARLEVVEGGQPAYTLLPGQYLYRPQFESATMVAIHSTWAGDFYTILHGRRGPDRVSLTLVENPLMRWLWTGGIVAVVGAVWGLWPSRRPSRGTPPVPRPKGAALRRRANIIRVRGKP